MSLVHQWVDVGFIHERMVCKYCDSEKETTYNYYCAVREQMAMEEVMMQELQDEPAVFTPEFDTTNIGD